MSEEEWEKLKREFVHKLNAMENAVVSQSPNAHGYSAKRQAVLRAFIEAYEAGRKRGC